MKVIRHKKSPTMKHTCQACMPESNVTAKRATAFRNSISEFTKKSLLFLFVSACSLSAAAQTTLFESPFTSVYNSQMPYRIPAIVETVDADGKPKVITFADKRHGGGDVGQSNILGNGAENAHINLVFKTSTDYGASWDASETTIKEGNENFGYGDIAVVADRENPENIVFFCAAGNTFFTKSTASNRLLCYRFRSSDGGATWDAGTDVTSDIYSLFSYDGAFFSSGRICQSSKIKVGTHYRLYAALCLYTQPDYFWQSGSTNSVVLYSDDFGATWNLLGSAPTISGGDEAKCVELPNGNVLVSSKSTSKRIFRVFSYSDITSVTQNTASGSWSSQKDGCTNGDSSGTNGELLLVPAYDASGNACNVLLQSVPNASSRNHVTIFWKLLDETALGSADQYAGTWTGSCKVSGTTSAYSSMILQSDGNIGFVYEEDYQDLGSGGYNIKYKSLTLSDITNKTYTTVAPETPETPETPDYAAFAVQPVEGKIGAQTCYLATFSASVPTMVPSGVTAYFVKMVSDTEVILSRVNSTMAIPAGEGVILRSTGSAAFDMNEVSAESTMADLTGNLLRGTCDAESTTLTSTDYVLALKGSGELQGQFAFCLVGDASVTQPAHRAYLQMASGASLVRMMFDDDDVTGIEDLETDIRSSVIYDLQGRKVKSPAKGLYISNGKIVLKH